MNQKQLTRLCQEWQGRLRLRDWDIKVQFSPAREIAGDAKTSYSSGLKAASIQICRPDEHGQSYGQPYDTEQFLVHELLHLHFAGIDRYEADSIQYTTLEAAIDLIGWALVRARREGK